MLSFLKPSPSHSRPFLLPQSSPTHHSSPLPPKPINLYLKKPRSVFKCWAPNAREQKILDFCSWTGPIPKTEFYPEGDVLDCFQPALNNSVMYCAHTFLSKNIVNCFPCPWLLAAIQLAGGFVYTSRSPEPDRPPHTDYEFWLSLFPVALVNAIGHVALMVSLSSSSVFFTGVMRCGEPVYNMLLCSLFLRRGKWFPLPVYLSLLPIIGGCTIAAVTELNFNMTGVISAMIANLAFGLVNIFVERGLTKKDVKVTGINYGACVSILSFLILVPFSLAIDGPRLWAADWWKPGYNFYQFIYYGILYGTYIEYSYQLLPFKQPFPFFTVNNINKISVIVFSIIFVRHVQPISVLGAAFAILGIVLHSRELCKVFVTRNGSSNTIGFLHGCCS